MTMPQVFRRRGVPELSALPPLPVAVDMDGLERHLRQGTELADYAPKRPQVEDIDRAVRTITTFGELPAREIDDAIAALKEELALIEADAQRVRTAYTEVTDRLMRNVERQKAVHQIAKTAFVAMRQQCAALEQGELPLEPPAIAEPVEEPSTPGAP